MEQKPPQITLTIFLIKIDATDIATFFSDLGSLDHHSLKDGKTLWRSGYLQPSVCARHRVWGAIPDSASL